MNISQDVNAEAPYEQLARLHVSILPDSMVARLGVSFAKRFYRFACHSAHELVLFEEDGKCVVAGAVASLRPTTLARRTMLRTPFVLYAALKPSAMPWTDLIRERIRPVVTAASSGPELVYMFTSAAQRGRGHGRRLLQRLERLLTARGVGLYTVRTFDNESDPAVRFYLANSFAIVERIRTHGMNYLVLERKLQRPAATTA